MATREEFGNYLLLKKLTEDPLGETFRAGRVGDQGMDQVVLLRALNGPRLDTARLADALPGRVPIQQGLKSPNIGNGVDLGDVKGVPFVAYDYISGKNLATLLGEAHRQSSPIALDHALLITERIAQALAVAYETRLGNERVLHGFVVPHLVRVSNEGETRLLGFEVGRILQEMAGRGLFEPAISAYLAPEILAGEAPSKSDDIYSLGAVLFQLLTGAAPTASDPSGLVQEIDRAVVAAEQTPIPAPLATLLKKSLTPRDTRVPEAVSWHTALSKIIVEGGYNATTFNLAFFMHNLFRSEIELETQELEAEKKIKVEERLAPPAMPETFDEPQAAPEITGSHAVYGSEVSGGGSKIGLWIGLAAVLLLAVAGGSWYFLMGPGAGGTGEPVEPETQATTQPPVPEPVDLPPSPLDEPGVEEDAEAEAAEAEAQAAALQEQIQKMISDSNQDLEAKLGAQYESRIRELQKQLAETQKAAERAREEATRQQAEDETQQAAKAQDIPSSGTREATEDRQGPAATDRQASDEPATRPSPAGSSAGDDPTTTTPPRVADSGADRPAGSTDQGGTSQPSQTARQQPTTARQQPTTRQQSAPVEPTPPEPPQVTPPEIVRNPQARYPEIARRMGRQATVLLRVLVDENGRVVDVERIGKRVGSGFDEAAAEAARQARYRPGTEDGRPKSMWTTLRIEFRPPS